MEVIFQERPLGALRTGSIVVDFEQLTKWINSKIGVIYSTYYGMLEKGAGDAGVSFITDCVYAGIFAKAKGILNQESQSSEIQKFLEENKIVTFDDFIKSFGDLTKLVAEDGLKNIDEILEAIEQYSKEVGIDFDGLTEFILATPPNIVIPATFIGFYTGVWFASENPNGISLGKFFDPSIM